MKNDLVGLIYEAAFDASGWQEVLTSLMTETESGGAQLLMWDSHSNGAASSLMVGGPSNPDLAERLYAEHFGAIDPRRQHALKMPVGRWFGCHSICDERFVAGSEFYQDYFIPVCEGRYMCGTRLADQHGMNAMLAIGRAVGKKPFDPISLALLDGLSPHLSRAAKLHLKISRLQGEVAARQEALNRLALPILISGLDGRIRFANQAAESFLEYAAGPFKFQFGRLFARGLSDSARLTKAIDSAVQYSVGGAFVLGKSTPDPVLCTVVPLSARSALASEWQSPLAAVFLSRPHVDGRIDKAILREMYGLTPAESRLAVELAAGLSLEACAERFCVSLRTVRTQLRAVFQKVGVNRQAELTAMLQSLVSPVI
ncbi:MAG: LuxR C-terminal-related transcriptional regulator [Lautropia sp.]